MNPVGKAINNYPHGSMICRIHKNGEFGDGGSYCFTNLTLIIGFHQLLWGYTLHEMNIDSENRHVFSGK